MTLDLTNLPVKQPDLSSLPVKNESSVKEDFLTRYEDRLAEHPFLGPFMPLSTLFGKSLEDRAFDATKPDEIKPDDIASYWGSVIKQTVAGSVGAIGDMATAPGSYVPVPGLGLVGKIPVGKTTLGEIVKKVPISQLASGGLAEKVAYQTALKNLPVKTAKSAGVFDDLAGKIDPVQKITNAIKQAKPIRQEQEILNRESRAKRIGAAEAIGNKSYGESGFKSQLGSLKGQLPKVSYEGVRDKVTQDDIDILFQKIQGSFLLPGEKLTAKHGLSKALGIEGGVVPTNKEIEYLSEVFGSDFSKAMLEKDAWKKLQSQAVDVLNLPRSIMSSADYSAPFRQGIFLIGRPKEFSNAFVNMFKYAFNEYAYDDLLIQIRNRPTYPLMREAKLPLTLVHGHLSGMEEGFKSVMAENIPGLGEVIKASNRAYSGFRNKLMADVFDSMIKTQQSLGIHPSKIALRNMGEYIGAATGRGKLPAMLEGSADLLNATFFSPRLMSSRLTLLNPQFYIKLDPFTRKQALSDLFKFAGLASTVLYLAKMSGAEVEANPQSADFGKIKVGITRYDILGGFGQYIRLAAQLITQTQINSVTGVKTDLSKPGYGEPNSLDAMINFAQSKEAPVVSFITDMLKGKNFKGEEFSFSNAILSRFIPLVFQDTSELFEERDHQGLLMALPAFVGIGTQTYNLSPKRKVSAAKAIMDYSNKLANEGRIEEAENFLFDRVGMYTEGLQLSGFQQSISKLEGLKENIQNNVLIKGDDKKEKVKELEKLISDIQKKMDERNMELKKEKK